MTVTEFSASLPDIPRFITALAEWLACFVCLLSLKKREWIDRGAFAAVSAGFLMFQCLFMVVTDGFDGIAWSLCMAAAVLLMFCYMRICAVMTLNNAICYCCIAFIEAEFAASIEWQIQCYIYVLGLRSLAWSLSVLILVYGVVFFLIWQFGRSVLASDEEFQVTGRDTIITVITAILIFAVSNLGFLPINLPFAGRDSREIFNMRTFVDLGGMAILYAYRSQWKSNHVQRELETIQTILNSQYEQYKQAQRTVDLINYRYHDLKNHIIALRADADAPQHYSEYLDKLEHEIRDYEAFNKTGNQVLDTLLTSKNLRCMQHKIDMTCVIDGRLFASMDVMDICSIFGNALDNAIECELKTQDYGKRMIHVDAFSEKSFLIIRFENYCEGNVRFDKGLPVTSKKGSMHGYGLKSLRYTVHKYKGEIQIDVRDHWFSLRILIPMDT